MRTPSKIARVILPVFACASLAFVAACSDANGPSNGGTTNVSLAVATLTAGSAGQMASGEASHPRSTAT